MIARHKPLRVESSAPFAGEERPLTQIDAWPAEPPSPLNRPPRPPVFRPLQVYAFGPSLGRTPINVRTILVRYEPLAPGPVGERIIVVDYDQARNCFYDPVNLDDPLIAMNGGLDPSESDPRFHQQMVYAVASDCLHRLEVALGRTIQRRTLTAAEPLRILMYPHAGWGANCFVDGNRVMFGYFQATHDAAGRTIPGQTVFTCLSADAIIHEVTHIVQTAMRPDLVENPSPDTTALLEALADLTSLLFHMGYREAVLDTIQRTAGVIYRSQIDATPDQAREGPRILAELTSNNPLLAMSQDFGEALGRTSGLRNALLAPDPLALERTNDPHGRGAIVVAAIFDALFSTYQRRTLDLFRIFRAGGGQLHGNFVPDPLANRLCTEVERIANRTLNMCWRAIDYCPTGNLELGDFLRACITADFEYSREDLWGLRDAMMQAFRVRGIRSSGAMFFTEDALRWRTVDRVNLNSSGPEKLSQDAIVDFVTANAKALGLPSKGAFRVYPIEQARLAAPDDTPQTRYFTQVLVGQPAHGATLVFDAQKSLIYAIRSENRSAARRKSGSPAP